MKSYKCPRCGMVGWATSHVCKSCGADVNYAAPTDYFVPFASDEATDRQSVRAAGLKKITIGIAGALLFGLFVFAVYASGYRLVGIGWFVLAIPPAWALVGVLEIMTGVPYNQLSQKWDELSAGRRRLLTFAAVVAAFALMIGGSILVVVVLIGLEV